MTGGIHRLGKTSGAPERPVMTVVGCGGAGCNTLARAAEQGWMLGRHLAVNTDAQHLLATRADRKVLIGRTTTGGRGANTDVAMGEAACNESRAELEAAMTETEVVVVLAGLGGGTGSGAAPMVAEMARNRGAMAISLSTMPFSVEGPTRMDNAIMGQTNLARFSDVAVVMPNDLLLETSPDVSLVEAFRTADDSLLEPVRLLRRLLTRADMPRLRTALDRIGRVHMGRGESDRRRGYGNALEDALGTLHPPVAPRTCDRGLVMFRADPEGPGDDLLYEMVRTLHLSMPRNTRMLWGVHRDASMADRLRVVVMLASAPKR